MKPRARKHANYACFHKLILARSNMASGTKQYVHFRYWAGLIAHTRRKTYMCIGGKNLSDSSFKGRAQARFELFSKIFETFNVVGCIPLQCVYGHAKKGIIYA